MSEIEPRLSQEELEGNNEQNITPKKEGQADVVEGNDKVEDQTSAAEEDEVDLLLAQHDESLARKAQTVKDAHQHYKDAKMRSFTHGYVESYGLDSHDKDQIENEVASLQSRADKLSEEMRKVATEIVRKKAQIAQIKERDPNALVETDAGKEALALKGKLDEEIGESQNNLDAFSKRKSELTKEATDLNENTTARDWVDRFNKHSDSVKELSAKPEVIDSLQEDAEMVNNEVKEQDNELKRMDNIKQNVPGLFKDLEGVLSGVDSGELTKNIGDKSELGSQIDRKISELDTTQDTIDLESLATEIENTKGMFSGGKRNRLEEKREDLEDLIKVKNDKRAKYESAQKIYNALLDKNSEINKYANDNNFSEVYGIEKGNLSFERVILAKAEAVEEHVKFVRKRAITPRDDYDF